MKPEKTGTVRRYVGECQICEGQFKVQDGRVVLHGYKRPGHGYIVGECMGRNEAPYELSCEAIPPWLRACESNMMNVARYLDDLKSGKLDRFFMPKGGYTDRGYTSKPFEAVRSELNAYTWKTNLEHHTHDAERQFKFWSDEVERLRKRIDNWKLRPLLEVDEAGRTPVENTERERRAAERQAARDAVTAKKNALAEKRGKILIERKKLLDAARAKILAVRHDKDAILAVLRDLTRKKNMSTIEPSFVDGDVARMKRKGIIPADLPDVGPVTDYHWTADLGVDDVLLAHGLAKREANYPIWYDAFQWRS
jgi:hypothetical protein